LRKRYFHAACLLVLTATACSGPRENNDYTGQAFPNRRAPIDGQGHLLGFVANRNSDTISVLDLDDMTELASVPIGRDPVEIDGPRHVLLDPSHGLAYVALSYPNSDRGAHAASEGVMQRAGYVEALRLTDLSVAGDVRLDPATSELARCDATGMLAATHYDVNRATLNTDPEARRASLALIDTPSAIATEDAKPRKFNLCAVPSSLGFNADGSRLYMACVGEDAILVVDPSNGQVLGRVDSGSSPANKPYALVADASRERLLVSNQVSSIVAVFDMADTPNLLASLFLGSKPMFATWITDSTVLVPHQDPSGVALFDVSTNMLELDAPLTLEQCQWPSEALMTRDGRIFIVCEGSHYTPGAVLELDPETLTVRSRVEVGLYPERLAILEP
jgi:hypothetical protein